MTKPAISTFSPKPTWVRAETLTSCREPVPAGVAGGVYKNLSQQNYFAANTTTAADEKSKDPFPILTSSPCCSQ